MSPDTGKQKACIKGYELRVCQRYVNKSIMKGWGITFLLLGIGSFVLPMMNLQFSLISIFGEGNEAITGGVFIAIGIILFLVGARRPAQG